MKRKLFTMIFALMALVAFNANAQTKYFWIDADTTTGPIYDPACYPQAPIGGFNNSLVSADGTYAIKDFGHSFVNKNARFEIIKANNLSDYQFKLKAQGNTSALSAKDAAGVSYDSWQLVQVSNKQKDVFRPDPSTGYYEEDVVWSGGATYDKRLIASEAAFDLVNSSMLDMIQDMKDLGVDEFYASSAFQIEFDNGGLGNWVAVYEAVKPVANAGEGSNQTVKLNSSYRVNVITTASDQQTAYAASQPLTLSQIQAGEAGYVIVPQNEDDFEDPSFLILLVKKTDGTLTVANYEQYEAGTKKDDGTYDASKALKLTHNPVYFQAEEIVGRWATIADFFSPVMIKTGVDKDGNPTYLTVSDTLTSHNATTDIFSVSPVTSPYAMDLFQFNDLYTDSIVTLQYSSAKEVIGGAGTGYFGGKLCLKNGKINNNDYFANFAVWIDDEGDMQLYPEYGFQFDYSKNKMVGNVLNACIDNDVIEYDPTDAEFATAFKIGKFNATGDVVVAPAGGYDDPKFTEYSELEFTLVAPTYYDGDFGCDEYVFIEELGADGLWYLWTFDGTSFSLAPKNTKLDNTNPAMHFAIELQTGETDVYDITDEISDQDQYINCQFIAGENANQYFAILGLANSTTDKKTLRVTCAACTTEGYKVFTAEELALGQAFVEAAHSDRFLWTSSYNAVKDSTYMPKLPAAMKDTLAAAQKFDLIDPAEFKDYLVVEESAFVDPNAIGDHSIAYYNLGIQVTETETLWMNVQRTEVHFTEATSADLATSAYSFCFPQRLGKTDKKPVTPEELFIQSAPIQTGALTASYLVKIDASSGLLAVSQVPANVDYSQDLGTGKLDATTWKMKTKDPDPVVPTGRWAVTTDFDNDTAVTRFCDGASHLTVKDTVGNTEADIFKVTPVTVASPHAIQLFTLNDVFTDSIVTLRYNSAKDFIGGAGTGYFGGELCLKKEANIATAAKIFTYFAVWIHEDGSTMELYPYYGFEFDYSVNKVVGNKINGAILNNKPEYKPTEIGFEDAFKIGSYDFKDKFATPVVVPTGGYDAKTEYAERKFEICLPYYTEGFCEHNYVAQKSGNTTYYWQDGKVLTAGPTVKSPADPTMHVAIELQANETYKYDMQFESATAAAKTGVKFIKKANGDFFVVDTEEILTISCVGTPDEDGCVTYYKVFENEELSMKWGFVEAYYEDRYIWTKSTSVADALACGLQFDKNNTSEFKNYFIVKESEFDNLSVGDHEVFYYNVAIKVSEKDTMWMYANETTKELHFTKKLDVKNGAYNFCFPYRLKSDTKTPYVGKNELFIRSGNGFLVKFESASGLLALTDIRNTTPDFSKDLGSATGKLDATSWVLYDAPAVNTEWMAINAELNHTAEYAFGDPNFYTVAPSSATGYLAAATNGDPATKGAMVVVPSGNTPNYGVLDAYKTTNDLKFEYLGDTLIGQYTAQRPIWYYRISKGDQYLTNAVDSVKDDYYWTLANNKYPYAFFGAKNETATPGYGDLSNCDTLFQQSFALRMVPKDLQPESDQEKYYFWVVSQADFTGTINKVAGTNKTTDYYYLAQANGRLIFVPFSANTEPKDIADNALMFEFGVDNMGDYTDAPSVDAQVSVIGLDGAVQIDNVNGQVEIYTIDGRLVKSANVNGSARVAAPQGVVIVKAGQNVAKVVVK